MSFGEPICVNEPNFMHITQAGDVFGGNNWLNRTLFVVLSHYECKCAGVSSYESNSVKVGSPVWSQGANKNGGHKKLKTTHEWFSPICRNALTGVIGLNFGVLCYMADLITHTDFFDNRFREFGVLMPPILPFSTGIAGSPYSSVSTILKLESSNFV